MAKWQDEFISNPLDFADPGGRSALRRGTRNKPCPDCGEENVLTDRDVQLGYCCDECADRKEGKRFE